MTSCAVGLTPPPPFSSFMMWRRTEEVQAQNLSRTAGGRGDSIDYPGKNIALPRIAERF